MKYSELQVEEHPETKRSYKKIALIAGAIVVGCIVVIVLATTIPNSGKGTSDDIPFTFLYTNSSLLGPGPADGIPCIAGETNRPAGCKQRIVKCGTTKDLTGVKDTIPPATDTSCKKVPVLVGEIYVVQFYDSSRTCWEVKMEMGECWGKHPINTGSEYSCQGKCGAGCGNINCGAWARDCLRHDVCSWFYTATGGSKDPHCGESYDLAADDFWGNCDCNASGGKDKSLTSLCP